MKSHDLIVGEVGIEPTTFCSSCGYSNRIFIYNIVSNKIDTIENIN